MTFAVVPAATWPPVIVIMPDPFGMTGLVPGGVDLSTSNSVVLPVDPVDETYPLASTVKSSELKEAKPAFVAEEEAAAEERCATTVTVFPEPVVSKGMPLAATTVPRISRTFARGIAVPELVTKDVGI